MDLLLFAPSNLHKGFLVVMRVWVQGLTSLDSVCFSTEGVSCGPVCRAFSPDVVLVTGWM